MSRGTIDQSDGEDFSIYELPDELRSCDKPHHLETSLAHQPNHVQALGKIESKLSGYELAESNRRRARNWFLSHLPIIRSRDNRGGCD